MWQWNPHLIRIPSEDGDRTELVLPASAWCVVTSGALAAVDNIMNHATAHEKAIADGDDLNRLIDKLVQGGFVVLTDVARNEVAERTAGRFSADLVVTNRCNLRCYFCSVPMEDRSSPDVMSIETAERIGGMLSAFREFVAVTVTGGEPLFHRGLFDILDSLRSNSLTVALNTNGTRISTCDVARRIAGSVSAVVISIDGHNAAIHDQRRGRGTFARCMRALKLLTDAGCRVRIRSVALPGFEADEMARLARQYGAELVVNALIELGRAQTFSSDHAEYSNWLAASAELGIVRDCILKPGSVTVDLMRDFKRLFQLVVSDAIDASHAQSVLTFGYDGCPGVKSLLCFSTNGDIWPCDSAANGAFKRRFLIGNIWDDTSLQSIVDRSVVAQEFLSSMEERIPCNGCVARYHCLSGCRLVKRDTLSCSAVRDRVARVLWRFDASSGSRENLCRMYGDLLDVQGAFAAIQESNAADVPAAKQAEQKSEM